MGSAVSSPSGVCGGAKSKIAFGASQLVPSGGNNLNDFRENELTKSRTVCTVKACRGPKYSR